MLIFTPLICLLNIVVDPYLLFGRPRTAEFNARKPAIAEQEHLIKAYDVLRFEPETLLLGSSSIAMGLDARSSAWPLSARPVYNLGLPGEGVFAVRRYLQHVEARERLHTVILGLNFRDFLQLRGQHELLFESRLAVTRSGSPNPDASRQRLYDIAYASLSLDAILESINTLRGNISSDSPDTVSGNVEPYWHRTEISRGGAYQFVVLGDLYYSRIYRVSGMDAGVWDDVRQIFDLCQSRGIHLIVILEPVLVDELEVADIAGRWSAVEDWKRELTRMAFAYGNPPTSSHVELWDFLGYDSYSTESVPYSKSAMRWFLTPSHYTRALGDLMVKRITGSGDDSFGARLTPENIESHLSEVRQERDLYRVRQQSDAARVRRLYAAMN